LPEFSPQLLDLQLEKGDHCLVLGQLRASCGGFSFDAGSPGT